MPVKRIDKVTLIFPPYGERVPTPSTISAPMGLCSLAAFLLKNNFSVKVIDANVEGLNNEQIVERLKQDPPQAIGISCLFTAFYNSTKALAERLKQEFDAPIIVGGNQATAMSKLMIKDKNIDYIIEGEGELPFVNLLQALNNGKVDRKTIKGVAFREGEEVISTPRDGYIENLDDLPLPPYHLFPMERYCEYNVSASRGCPFGCTFCASNVIFGRGLRMRSVDNVIAELELLISRYGKKPLVFYDDFFTANKKYVEELMDKMIAKNWGLQWRCATRVNNIRPEVVAKLKAAGCVLMKYGVESASPEILKTIKKGISRREIEQALAVTKECGMPYSTFFMIGNRGENLETVKESFRLIKQLAIEEASFAITVPLPGTELAEGLVREGILDYSVIDWDLLLPIHLIDRGYEKHAAEMAGKWCDLTPGEILELAKIGALISRCNSFRAALKNKTSANNIYRHFLNMAKLFFENPLVFIKAVNMYNNL
ncbi:MAG: radical SAM protein [Candidatus Omnitrophota bacterium]